MDLTSQIWHQNRLSNTSRDYRKIFIKDDAILIVLLKNGIKIALGHFPEALGAFF